MTLRLDFGHATHPGEREANEDRAAYAAPDPVSAGVKGYVAVLADGMGGGLNGDEAAEAVTRSIIQDYYATPDTWAATHAMGRIIAALNRWLYGQSLSRRHAGGYASTLTSLVLRGQRYLLAHVGDSRAYLFRHGQLTQLTTDHVWEQPGMEHVLRRGMGLDALVVPDFSEGRVEPGDLFVLVSDGVWAPLPQPELHRLISLHSDVGTMARSLVEQAIRHGGTDNATALVVRVEAVPDEDLVDELSEARGLVVPGPLQPGMRLDDFEIEALVHDSRASRLYLGRQVGTGRRHVLKTLKPVMAADLSAKEHLLAEEWLGKRLQSAHFPQVLPLPSRNHLYFAQAWHPGRTLEQALHAGEHFPVADAVGIGIQLAKGLAALHRMDILHRDIKPDNLHLAEDGTLRILDLGVAVCPALEIEPPEDALPVGVPGTPSYMAPELFAGAPAGWATDIYAAGVTLYHVLTRRYPYGEVEPFQHPRFGEPVLPSRFRPDLPGWLERVLLKAVAREPGHRFETADELLLALERGDALDVRVPRRAPMLERNPLAVWHAIAAISLVMNLLLLYLLLVG